ncbi:unnamed protein product [Paramecium sonneborni]|uniref:Uncharacterized protein n=1 Tax=Paramecium sonneborni TaxID=65129 RepID=A0A8S1PV29_9CILI|nr:unnamed protein product [Paramecium sonneborni]
MFNPLNRARSPQYNGYPNQTNPQYGGNQYPFTGQQSPMNQPLTQRSFPYQQYPQNTPPKGYPMQQSQRNNGPFVQPPQFPPSQPSVQSIQQPAPQSQPPQQQVPQQNYAQIPQRAQKQLPQTQMEQQKQPSVQTTTIQPQGQYIPAQSSSLGLSGLRQTYTPPTFVPLQPIMTTVIQRPIEFVDLEKFEELWDKRLKELEDKIRQSKQEPEIELRASNDDNEDKDALIKQLQDELYKIRCDNDDKNDKIKNLKIELQTNIELVEYLRLQLANSNHQIDERDEHIQNLEKELEELRQHIETLTEEVTTSQSVKTYEEEAKIWKSKFKELNDTYHACQEKLTLTEAELALLRRPPTQQKIVTTTSTVVKNNVQTSGTKSDSDYLSSSLTQQDVERIQNLSKNIPQI